MAHPSSPPLQQNYLSIYLSTHTHWALPDRSKPHFSVVLLKPICWSRCNRRARSTDNKVLYHIYQYKASVCLSVCLSVCWMKGFIMIPVWTWFQFFYRQSNRTLTWFPDVYLKVFIWKSQIKSTSLCSSKIFKNNSIVHAGETLSNPQDIFPKTVQTGNPWRLTHVSNRTPKNMQRLSEVRNLSEVTKLIQRTNWQM